MFEKILKALSYKYNVYIVIIFLIILTILYFVWEAYYIKLTMPNDMDNKFKQVVVKLDIPKITDKQKGSYIDIYVPPELYADREQSQFTQHNFLGRTSENTLTLLPDNKILYTNIANCGSIIIDFKKKVAYTINSGYINSDPVLLPDGKVYFFYGSSVYDSRLNEFISIARMILYVDSRTTTLLPDNKILITGGRDGSKLYGENPLNPKNKFSEAEIYDPHLNKYTAISNMNAKRFHHTATLLKNGKVLIVGGNYKDQPYAELFDYKTRKFYPLNYKGKSRFNHTATLLPDGKVLIIGGIDLSRFTEDSETKYSDVEVFDPQTNKFKQIGNLIYPNWEHTSILLKSNKIFVTGGGGCNKLETGNCNAQLYDLKTNKTSLTPGSSLWDSSVIMLKDGKVLIVNNGYLYLKNKIRLYIP